MDIVFFDAGEKGQGIISDSDEVLVAKSKDNKNIKDGQTIRTCDSSGNDSLFVICKNPSREQIGKGVDLAYYFESQTKSDFMHHRNSGLNHILCKILKEKEIIVGFDMSLILENPGKAHIYLGRMQQNVKLCRKYKVDMVVLSFAKSQEYLRGDDERESFARLIGMSPSEITASRNLIQDRIEFNSLKKKGLADAGIRAVK